MRKMTDAGIKDGLEAVARVRATITARLGAAEQRAAEAEAELLGFRQLQGFADMVAETLRDELARREQERQDG